MRWSWPSFGIGAAAVVGLVVLAVVVMNVLYPVGEDG